MSERIEALLRKVRLSKAKEGDPKEALYALIEEIEHSTGYSGKDSWNIAVELIADYLGIIRDPWRYSIPGMQNSPLFKGKEALSRQTFKISDAALKAKNRCAELVEIYVASAKAKPWDYLGDIFMEQRLHGKNLGQVLTPRSVVQLMIGMVMADYHARKERAWVDAETLMWVAEYMLKHGPPIWAAKALERAEKNISDLNRPYTVLDPCVGTGRFLIEASLMNPNDPLVLFGIEIDLWLYRACLVNMAMFSRHPYSIICADALRIDEKHAHTTSPIWDMGNLWDPPDFTPFYWKEPPITANKFSLSEWIKLKKG
jgi:hypothetical protein